MDDKMKVWFLAIEKEDEELQLLGLGDFEGEDSIGRFIPFFSSYDRALEAAHSLGLNNEEMEDIYPNIFSGYITDIERCDEL